MKTLKIKVSPTTYAETIFKSRGPVKSLLMCTQYDRTHLGADNSTPNPYFHFWHTVNRVLIKLTIKAGLQDVVAKELNRAIA